MAMTTNRCTTDEREAVRRLVRDRLSTDGRTYCPGSLPQAARNARESARTLRRFLRLERLGIVRIDERPDLDARWEDIAGDTYDVDAHRDTVPGGERTIRAQEKRERGRMDRDGVWGYVAQVRTPDGWEDVDSCWGFVGDDYDGSGYDDDHRAAVVDAARQMIRRRKYARDACLLRRWIRYATTGRAETGFSIAGRGADRRHAGPRIRAPPVAPRALTHPRRTPETGRGAFPARSGQEASRKEPTMRQYADPRRELARRRLEIARIMRRVARTPGQPASRPRRTRGGQPGTHRAGRGRGVKHYEIMQEGRGRWRVVHRASGLSVVPSTSELARPVRKVDAECAARKCEQVAPDGRPGRGRAGAGRGGVPAGAAPVSRPADGGSHHGAGYARRADSGRGCRVILQRHESGEALGIDTAEPVVVVRAADLERLIGEDARAVMRHAASCIGRAESQGVYRDCVVPEIGTRTVRNLESWLRLAGRTAASFNTCRDATQ